MRKWFIKNGAFVEEDQLEIGLNNRAFNYADGVFESLRAINGKVWSLGTHLSRLKQGLDLYQIEYGDRLNEDTFRKQINLLLEKNYINNGGRIKVWGFRKDGGLYEPISNELDYIVSVDKLENNLFKVNEVGLHLGVYNLIPKNRDAFSHLKSISKEVNVLSRVYAKQNDFDDALLINSEGNYIESSSSNLFVVIQGKIYTPPIKDGCVGGTMRMNVINAAIKSGYSIFESQINEDIMLEAEEVFLTNAVSGIQWVNRFKSKRYFRRIADVLVQELNRKAFDETMGYQSV